MISTALTDYKYIQIVSHNLPLWTLKQSNPILGNFRCVICGDSTTNKAKKRGYIYFQPEKSRYVYHCHNCGFNHGFGYFLKEWDENLYKQYTFDLFADQNIKQSKTFNTDVIESKTTSDVDYLKGLTKVSSLHHNHKAKVYIQERKIPANLHYDIFYSPNFAQWCVDVGLEKEATSIKHDPRIVFFLRDRQGVPFGVSGRTIDPRNSLRYNIRLFDDKHVKVFGLDKIDPNKMVYVFEGQIDSLFMPNSIALLGQGVNIEKVMKLGNLYKDKLTFILDNEPRNKDTVNHITALISAGYNVVIFPDHIKQKDINKMIVDGVLTTPTAVQKIIKDNTYNGLAAMMKLGTWRKV